MNTQEFSRGDYFFIFEPKYIEYATYSVVAVRKEIVHLNKLDDLAHHLNIDKQEGAHLLLIPTQFYMQEYLEFDKEYYVCLYIQFWG